MDTRIQYKSIIKVNNFHLLTSMTLISLERLKSVLRA